MKNKLLIPGLFVLALFFSLSSCKKDDDEEETPTPTATYGSMRIEFEHVFGTSDFALGTAFANGSSENLTFTTLKYYISNIVLTKADGSTWAEKESYHLVNFADAASTLLTLDSVPTGDYKGFRFTIGVDSTRNVSGAQTGALDPANGMFWTWNSGYIFMKAEGTSPQISGMGNAFEYHLGGFKVSNGTKCDQQFSHTFSGEVATVSTIATPQVHMMVDVKQLFDGATPFSAAAMPMIHMPGSDAVNMMSNFGSGFEFEHLHN